MKPRTLSSRSLLLAVLVAAPVLPVLRGMSWAGSSAARAISCKRTCVDIDGDCQSTTSDALASLKVNVGIYVPYVSSNLKLTDANRDGKLTVRDTLVLLRRIVDQNLELPCEIPVNPTSTTTTST